MLYWNIDSQLFSSFMELFFVRIPISIPGLFFVGR